jgi:hypothetical protein
MGLPPLADAMDPPHCLSLSCHIQQGLYEDHMGCLCQVEAWVYWWGRMISVGGKHGDKALPLPGDEQMDKMGNKTSRLNLWTHASKVRAPKQEGNNIKVADVAWAHLLRHG